MLAAFGKCQQDRRDLAGDRMTGFGGVTCHEPQLLRARPCPKTGRPPVPPGLWHLGSLLAFTSIRPPETMNPYMRPDGERVVSRGHDICGNDGPRPAAVAS